MKAKSETTLFTVLTGSHLYGTSTDTSDYDFKSVCLPPISELLLNTKITNRKQKPEGSGPQAKMQAGEIETEYLPLQIFFNDFFDGQTYALEVAFAVLEDRHMVPRDIDSNQVKNIVRELVARFLTKNVQKMVGYAISQSRLYGLKTQRYASIKQALDIINGYVAASNSRIIEKTALRDCPDLIDNLLTLDFIKSIEIMNAAGGKEPAPGIDICNKQFPLTSRIDTILASLNKSVSGYGERVKEFEGDGVDWKALSHAIRITEQVLELCRTGYLKFPRPNAPFLLSVKSGKFTLEEATEYLNRAFSYVDSAIEASTLQIRTPQLEESFKEWKIQVLGDLYGID